MSDANVSSGPDGLGLQSVWDSTKVAVSGALRTAPLWILAGLFAYVVVGRVSDSQIPDPTATAEIGLTDQVVWPFYDVVLSETEALALESQPAAEGAIGDSLIEYEVSRPDNVGLIEIRVTATSEEAAREGVVAVSDAMIAEDLRVVTKQITDEIDALAASEAASTVELDAVIERIEALTAQFVPNLEESTRRLLDQQLQIVNAERDSAQRLQLRAREDLQRLGVELETTTSQIELTNLSSTAVAQTSSRSLQLAAAVGVAIAAALALNVLSRENGRIQNPAHVRAVMGLPSIQFPDSPTSSVALARLLYALREESGTRMIGVSAIPTGADSAHEMSLALKSIGEDILVTEFGFDSDKSEGLAFSILDPFDATTIDAQMACDAVIVVVWEKNTRMWDLRRKVSQLEERGLPVRGVLLRRED